MIFSNDRIKKKKKKKTTQHVIPQQVSLPEKILVAYRYGWKRKFSLEGYLDIDRLRISKEIEQTRNHECEEKW